MAASRRIGLSTNSVTVRGGGAFSAQPARMPIPTNNAVKCLVMVADMFRKID
jgi:hypothetical protein